MFKKMLLAIMVIVRLAFFAGPAVAAEETSLEQVRAIVEPSIVYLDVTYTAWVWDEFYGQYVSSQPFTVGAGCTGFVVNPNGYLMTAGHCVDVDASIRDAIIESAAEWAFKNDYYSYDEGETRADVRKWANDDFRIEDADYALGNADVSVTAYRAVSQSGSTEWQDHAARVVEVMEFGEGDLALLKVEAKHLPALELAPNDSIGVGSDVITVGYAGSVESVTDISASPSYKDGTVSSERTLAGGLVPVYEVSAALSPGMSGGPAVDSQGRVVGINSFTITDESQAFNFISPVSLVAETMSGRNVNNVLNAVAIAYREGITALYAGDKEAALFGINTAKEAWGSLDVIDDLLDKASALEDAVVVDIEEPAAQSDDEAPADEQAGVGDAETAIAGSAAPAVDPTSGPNHPVADEGSNSGLIALGVAAAAGAGVFAHRRRSAQETTPVVDHVGRLEQLKELRDAGIITDADFEAARDQAVAHLTGAGV